MRLLFPCLAFFFTSCSNSVQHNILSDKLKTDSAVLPMSHFDSLLVDTPKLIKARKDYICIAPSEHDYVYFGDKFSPYKIEPYEIRGIELVIDSLIKAYQAKGFFKGKSIKDFKYQIISVKTSKKTFQSRVQAICNEEVKAKKWNSSRFFIEDGGDCYFSLMYDIIKKKVLSFEINSNG